MLPPLSARRPLAATSPFPEEALYSQRGLNASIGSSTTPDLSVRRKQCVKKAFKRLDPLGSGVVRLQDAFEALAAAPQLSPAGQEELKQALSKLATQTPDGRPVFTFAAFLSYYHDVSPGIGSESDFEQLLEAHWGYLEVSDIIAALQRQLTLAGLSVAFQGYTDPGQFRSMAAKEFDGCLKRVGLQLRPADLQRLFGAFSCMGQGLGLDEFKEQLVSPRPETPVPRPRALPSPFPAGGRTSPGPGPTTNPFPATTATMPAPTMPVAGSGTMPGAVTAPTAPPPRPATTEHALTAKPPAQPIQTSPAIAPKHPAEVHAMLGQMEAELQTLKDKKAAVHASAASGAADPEAPVKMAELDAALENMTSHLNHVKAHKVHADKAATQAAIADLGGLAEMPHWEHHKYGHHKITAPEWKPDAKITDMYGHQHAASEYHYSNYGAGSHGHHLAHYHLNDYHGLAHHSFAKEEYQKKTYGDKAHHGHWVPHLHGIGTASHHGEHSYAAEDYGKQSYGNPGHHSHWVPHLHGMGSG
mmetsp:Transcript_81359/g.141179  ORF Transcript_81359/g.141179 Transcript_81359/m.141179 type:complete len:529 (+) Transcript_81359:46-1632(+)